MCVRCYAPTHFCFCFSVSMFWLALHHRPFGRWSTLNCSARLDKSILGQSVQQAWHCMYGAHCFALIGQGALCVRCYAATFLGFCSVSLFWLVLHHRPLTMNRLNIYDTPPRIGRWSTLDCRARLDKSSVRQSVQRARHCMVHMCRRLEMVATTAFEAIPSLSEVGLR